MMNMFSKIFSIKKQGELKIITFFGIKIKCKDKIKMLENKLKKEVERSNYIHEKRFEQFLLTYRWLRHTNRIVNKLIEDLNEEDLKISQIKYLFKNIHKNEYELNIDNPKSFNEKIHWLSFNYYKDNEKIQRIIDKYRFKDYIKEKLGDGYTIPLLGKWDNPYDIDFDKLPDSFVLKSNWGGDDDQVLIVEDKNKLNVDDTKNKLADWLSSMGNPYYYAFNPIFKNIKPCIIAEELVKTDSDYCMLDDYKFFCFNGKFQLGYVDIRTRNGGKIYFFDKEWQLLPIVRNEHVYEKTYFPEKPACFEKLVEIAEKLAADFPFARVDFYIPDGKIYVGEITFTPGGGFNHYTPIEWDYKMGEMLDISELMKEKNNA